MNAEKDGKILIVDDEPVNLTVLADLLQKHYHVFLAKDGEQALRRARTNPPDLILLDVVLPGESGFDICRRLKDDALTRDIPVIFISASSDLADKVRGFASGGLDYVTKPIQEQEVLARVGVHLALRAAQRQLLGQNDRLVQEIQERKKAEAEREKLIHELQAALQEVKTLRGFLPICAHCKKVRDDEGYWQQIEGYIQARSEAQFSHGICPDCLEKYYPEVYAKMRKHQKREG